MYCWRKSKDNAQNCELFSNRIYNLKSGETWRIILLNLLLQSSGLHKWCKTKLWYIFIAFVVLSFLSYDLTFLKKEEILFLELYFFFFSFVLILVPESSLLWTIEKLLHKLQPCGKYLSVLSYVKWSSNSLQKEHVVFLGTRCQWAVIIKITSVSIICERSAIS